MKSEQTRILEQFITQMPLGKICGNHINSPGAFVWFPYWLNEGRIIEKGTHEELLDAGGFYSNLYYSQFKSGSGEILVD